VACGNRLRTPTSWTRTGNALESDAGASSAYFASRHAVERSHREQLTHDITLDGVTTQEPKGPRRSIVAELRPDDGRRCRRARGRCCPDDGCSGGHPWWRASGPISRLLPAGLGGASPDRSRGDLRAGPCLSGPRHGRAGSPPLNPPGGRSTATLSGRDAGSDVVNPAPPALSVIVAGPPDPVADP